jgi:UDPglucose--hexose-1-phosphate uridylyltransferase
LPHYHWHVEVLPRLMQLAGYEWGTGAHVNPVLPEDAAAILREM